MSSLTQVSPSPPYLFKDPAIVEATLMTLLARVKILEDRTSCDSAATSTSSKQVLHAQIEHQSTESLLPNERISVVNLIPDGEKTAAISVSEVESFEDVGLANTILDVITSYGVREEQSQGKPCEARKKFLPVVLECLKAEAPIKLILPAFPFKSPNRSNKVLGALPDLGEAIALETLQGLCDNIQDIYEHGAHCYITSDGLVYNDILGVDDLDVLNYGQELRDMAKRRGLTSLKFLRLADLLAMAPHRSSDTRSRKLSTTEKHVTCIRREFLARYLSPGFDASVAIKEDIDTRLTYQGYLRFLKRDLEGWEELRYDEARKPISSKKSQKMIGDIAKRMIARGAAFAAAIRDSRNLQIPRQFDSTTFGQIWRDPMALDHCPGLDGSFETGHAEDFANTHDLIYLHGRPYYYREKSELFDWGDTKVEFEPMYPCGLVIRPSDGPLSARHIPMGKVKQLSINLSPIVLRGFQDTLDEDVYLDKAHEAGKVLPWSFGIIQKVKDAGDNTKQGNNVTSNEAMPMHFDGMFKFEEIQDPVTGETHRVQIPPGFQFFTAPVVAPEGTGYTLFASSRLFFKYLRAPYSAERFEKIRWNMDNDGFWNAKMKDLPLVVRHPETNAPCLRWHEPWDETKTKFSTCTVTLSNDEAEIIDVITKLLYDRRVVLRFTWRKGDWLVNDNTSMLHTRTGYTSGCDRELWRIHFD
ncbi:Pyoverdine biosynthesis [Fusarium tjaetaba]|uniref:Pyoverdine biosynthesis n=1 Tax=Fusarium tjaetaba TaxID=1567544 RepID=A0A8H5W4K9_9HYPO|nr:Pyoverdine biosynthesis [Fusarium tjaetaba]KAF5646711.1 Pyoverdine biosynthesis [Fusarium tjaetaba]